MAAAGLLPGLTCACVKLHSQPSPPSTFHEMWTGSRNVVNAVADALTSASPETDPATAEAVARHSVRQVREERMADYAR